MSPGPGASPRPEDGGRLVGVISDTHGLLRPQAVAALEGCELIVHAGDVGSPAVLPELRRIAPVVAVRGNVDVESWARDLPGTAVAEAGAVRLFVLHDLAQLAVEPVAAGFAAVVSGHTHEAVVFERHGVIYLNPGSAGPRRFAKPVSLALLRVRGGAVRAELVVLDV